MVATVPPNFTSATLCNGQWREFPSLSTKPNHGPHPLLQLYVNQTSEGEQTNLNGIFHHMVIRNQMPSSVTKKLPLAMWCRR